MPYLLEDLVVNRVDLVDEGANSAAFIELFKRKERSDTMEFTEILKSMTPEHAAVVQAEITRLDGEIAKTKTTAEQAAAAEAAATGSATEAKEEAKRANETCAKVQEELSTLKAASTESFDESETLKAMPEAARVLFTKMKAQKDAAEEAVRKARDAEVEATAVAKASELKALPVEQSKLVGILKSCSPELFEVLTAVNAAIDSNVLGEVGKSKPGEVSTTSNAAWGKIEAKAEEILKAKPTITKAKAISEAVTQNPDLYKEYLKGGAN